MCLNVAIARCSGQLYSLAPVFRIGARPLCEMFILNSMFRSLRAYTARQLSQHAARVMDSQGQPPEVGRDEQDLFLDLMSQVCIVATQPARLLWRSGHDVTLMNVGHRTLCFGPASCIVHFAKMLCATCNAHVVLAGF